MAIARPSFGRGCIGCGNICEPLGVCGLRSVRLWAWLQLVAKISAGIYRCAGCGVSLGGHACSKIMRCTMTLPVEKCRHDHARLHALRHRVIDRRMRRSRWVFVRRTVFE